MPRTSKNKCEIINDEIMNLLHVNEGKAYFC